jgi:hypothetical protein
MTLYGLVRMGNPDEAVRYLKKTRGLPAMEAKMIVAKCARDLGMI